MPQTWLSTHLFYTDPIDTFLAKAVKNYTDAVINVGAANAFFFIRYQERGPHIRLRVLSDTQVSEEIVRPNIEEHFKNYFKMYPSKRLDPSFHPSAQASEIWLPNNTLQFITYEPEVERYGGEKGLQLAEHQFFISSKTVLEAIVPKCSYQEIMGTAIKLHLGMAYAVGMSIEKAADFFAEVSAHWLPFAIARERMTKAQYQHHLEMMQENFEQGFQEQKESMISYHSACWEIFLKEDGFEESYLNDWIKDNRRIGLEYRLAQAQQLLNPRPPDFCMKMQGNIEAEEFELWQYYADFVHLTNNRLGIGNEDGSYLAYLMMRSLEEML
jgi:hypothetical protein